VNNSTVNLSQRQYDWLARQLPEPVAKTGRRPIPNERLLGGILYVLKTGCQWYLIPESVCEYGYVSCWRRFNFWRRKRGLRDVWKQVLKLLDKEGELDLSLGHIDGSLVQSPKFKSGTGYSGKHKKTGTNAVLVTEKNGLPLASVTIDGNRQDRVVADKVIAKIRVGAKRRVLKLNGDKGFDGAPLRQALRKRNIAPNIPERVFKNRRKRGRKPRYDKVSGKFRAFVERTVAWIKNYRKLRYRHDRKKCMFHAFLDLACLVICLQRVGVLK
jgi:putative transposase